MIRMAIVEVKLKSNVDTAKQECQQKLTDCLYAIGLDCASTAAAKAPYKTGALRNSINYAVDPAELAVYIGTNIEYAIFQEEGTSKIRGKHFLRFAAQAHRSDYEKLIETYLSFD